MNVNIEVDDSIIKEHVQARILERLRNEALCIIQQQRENVVELCRDTIAKEVPGIVKEILGDSEHIKKLVNNSVQSRVSRIIREAT